MEAPVKRGRARAWAAERRLKWSISSIPVRRREEGGARREERGGRREEGEIRRAVSEEERGGRKEGERKVRSKSWRKGRRLKEEGERGK
eukprot:3344666-Rhodomonas_salina.1